jgi:hypothetical protein
LPQPTGEKLAKRAREYNNVDVHKMYMTPDAFRALRLHDERRFAKAGERDAQKAAAEEEFIKKHLVQMNIEGITTLYSEDLMPYYKSIVKYAPLLRGLSDAEKKAVIDAAAGQESPNLPKAAWVVEIRGYYYHQDGELFLEKTLLLNLRNPAQEGVNPNLDSKIKDHILKNVGYFVKYKNERIRNPEPGIFAYIRTSHLRSLLTGPLDPTGGFGTSATQMGSGMMGAPAGDPMPGGVADPTKPNRATWRPIGEVAPSALGAGGEGGGGFMGGGFAGFGGPPPAGDRDRPNMPTPMNVAPMAVGPAGVAVQRPTRQDRYEFIVLFIWKEPGSAPAQPAAEVTAN